MTSAPRRFACRTAPCALALLPLFATTGCESSLDATTRPVTEGSGDRPAEVQLTASTPQPKAELPPDRVLPRTFDDIKFDIEPDAPFDRSMLTDEIEQLNGRRIEIRGYILPSFRNKLRDFVLVRDDQECCFGPGAALYDCILVDMAPGKVAEFSTRPVAVEGVFRIEPFEFDGQTRAVFRMVANEVD